MRFAFLIAIVAGFVMAIVGLISEPRMMDGVAGQAVDEWYTSGMVWSAVLGGFIGACAAWLAVRWLYHKPRESATKFNSRVAAWGFWTIFAIVALTLLANAIRAAGAVFIPLSPMDRVVGLLGTSRFLAVVGVAAITGALGFAVVTRVWNWGGRYAIMSIQSD